MGRWIVKFWSLFNSPLEQFEIIPLFGVFGIFDLFEVCFSNLSFFVLLGLLVLFLFFYVGFSRAFVVPSRVQFVIEEFYAFLYSMLVQQAGLRGNGFFPFLVSIFSFIFLSNFLGLIPFSFTVTSSLFITFFFAFSFNVGFVFWGFMKHGLTFLQLFVPSGVPAALKPLIVVIEVMSYIIRSFSLSLRLFANMMAGHTLLQILASFVYAFLVSLGVFGFLAFVPFLLVLFVFLLECGIAFLQAYVFSILLCIYLNDSLNLH